MTVRPANTVLICSDQHNPFITGCYGNSFVQTPNLDRLAATGTRFANVYTPSPICVPARACMAAGRYVHQLETWDNSAPYTGREAASWGHRLVEQGFHVTTIGKLHYQSSSVPTGFSDQRIPMHVTEGIGNAYGLLREDMPPLPQFRQQILDAGAGESKYTRYDREVAELATRWLRQENRQHNRPWVLVVSFTLPHPPFHVPQIYLDRYALEHVPLRPNWRSDEWSNHSEIEWLRRQQVLTEAFDEETIRTATAIYYGMVGFLDEQIGKVIQAVEETDLTDTTRIIYTSDHGEMLGELGIWFKSCMYEGAARVPLIMAGPDIPQNSVCETVVSLVDLFPTLVESVGAGLEKADADLPGSSLLQIARQQLAERLAFSEFHGALSRAGIFMIRMGRWKYVHYVGATHQLFDLERDPEEAHNLINEPDYNDVQRHCDQRLRTIVDPAEIDRRAHDNQRKKLLALGGAEAVLRAGFKIPFTPPPDIE